MITNDSKKTGPQVALVTGASSGIGLELARCLAQGGYALVLVARRRRELEQLAEELRAAYGVDVEVLVKDLADSEAPGQICAELEARGTRIDILVNNAGFGVQGPFVDSDIDRQLAMLKVNIIALTHLTRLFLPGMIVRGRGRILNVASMAAFEPGPLLAGYYASKAYVLSFSEAIADELRHTPITVTALCPGATRTQFEQCAGLESSLLFSMLPMSAASVAWIGYRGMLHGRRVVIAGWRNWPVLWASRLLPRRLMATISRTINQTA